MAGTNTNSPTPPLAPAESDLWFNTTNGREYVWYISPGTGLGSWVQTQPTSEAAVPSNTPPTPPVTPPSVGPHDVTRVPTITVSQVPPLVPAPVQGDLWWSTISGEQFILYDDGTTTQWVLTNRGTGLQGPPGPPGPIYEIAEGAGIILTPNPIVATGVVAVDFTVVPHISDLGAYLPLLGGTLTGDLVVSHAGNAQIYVDSSDVGAGRPGFALTKRGTLEGIIQADGLTHGQIYYQSLAAGGVHQFYVNGALVVTIATGITTVIGNQVLSGTVAGNARSVHFRTSGSERWTVGPGFDAEGGGNAGSTFWIARYDDAGAFLGTPFQIARATGIAAFEQTPTAPTVAATDSSTSVATTQHVKSIGYGGTTAVRIANTMPGVGSPQVLDVTLGTGNWYTIGQIVWVQDCGYCQVYATNPNQVGIINLGYATNIAPTSAIAVGKRVVPAGPIDDTVSQQLSGINYTLILQDAGRHIYHQLGAAAATFTIPANASVAFPIGTVVEFVNDAVTAVTIAITTDVLAWSPTGATGPRTLAQFGVARALKVTATRWILTGFGIT